MTETQSYRYEGLITAMSSICHGGETKGTTQVLRSEKVVDARGQVAEVPVISGNAIRGILRDCGMRFMLRCLGDPPLSVAAVHFLFSGGALSKNPGQGEKSKKKPLGVATAQTLAIGDARTLMDAIPLVGVFGGACGSMIMEGKLRVGKAVPICQETDRIVPERWRDVEPPTVWEYLQTESYARRDDSKREPIRALLAVEERKLLEAAQSKSRQATVDGEADADVGQHQQMRYHVQTFAAGTRFYWWLSLHDATPLEWEALASCLVEFSRSPVIGGKGACGHGQIDMKLDGWLEAGPSVRQDAAIAAPLGKAYSEHLGARKEDILALLGQL